MNKLTDNIVNFHQRAHACLAAQQRSANSLTLICVSKNHPDSAIREAYTAGERHFGENRVQEALGKMTLLADLPDLIWHYIGTIQRNKINLIANHFAWVHSVTRLDQATRLAAQRSTQLAPLNVCIQVNIDNEPQKSGIAPTDVLSLAQAISTLPALTLRGLMAIPRPHTQTAFARMQILCQEICAAGIVLDTLSMGMSADWEQAIAHGATTVRLGTAIFGQRTTTIPKKPFP